MTLYPQLRHQHALRGPAGQGAAKPARAPSRPNCITECLRWTSRPSKVCSLRCPTTMRLMCWNPSWQIKHKIRYSPKYLTTEPLKNSPTCHLQNMCHTMQITYHTNMCHSMQTPSRTNMGNEILSIPHTNVGHTMHFFRL